MEDLTRAREELEHMAAKLRCVDEEKGAVMDRMRAMDAELRKRLDHIGFLEHERGRLTHEIGRLHMEHCRLRQENEQLQQENQHLKREIEQVKAAAEESTSAATCGPEIMMARIVPHDKKSGGDGGGRKGGL